VLALRVWTEVTLDAMLETIRSVLSAAGIRTLAWDIHTARRHTAVRRPLNFRSNGSSYSTLRSRMWPAAAEMR
jgi:hypothetical protein